MARNRQDAEPELSALTTLARALGLVVVPTCEGIEIRVPDMTTHQDGGVGIPRRPPLKPSPPPPKQVFKR